MSKEVKVGLAVIFSLAMVFGYTVYDRFFQPPVVADASGTVAGSVSTADEVVTQVVPAESTDVVAPKFAVAPAGQWEDVPKPSVTTFRAVEKPVLALKVDGGDYQAPVAQEASVAQAAPAAVPATPIAESGDAYQQSHPAASAMRPYTPGRVQPAAAQGEQAGGYQPPRVLGSSDPMQQAPAAAPVAQTAPSPRQASPYQAPVAVAQQPAQQSYSPAQQQQQPVANGSSQSGYRAPATPSYGAPANAAQVDYRQSAPSQAGRGTYQVGPNDTFWTISRKVYGSGSFFKALARHNSTKFPRADQLAVGDIVDTPSQRELALQYPELCPKPRAAAAAGGRFSSVSTSANAGGKTRSYEVQEGDTLFDIARYELGDGARWIEIYQLNQRTLTQDFNYIKPGTTIQLPGRGGPPKRESVARQPGGRSSR